jgi:branched-chain amino acid aminotransferase
MSSQDSVAPLAVLKPEDLQRKLTETLRDHQTNYWGFYSSFWGGICLDPHYLLIPVDDHMVHRGDGVFEALKVTGGKIYLLQPHLQRLLQSAAKIDLKHSWGIDSLAQIVEQTATQVLQGRTEAAIRIFLSRGAGSFGPNPADSTGAQLYVIITAPSSVAPEKFKKGVLCRRSRIPVKSGWFPQVKSCNYLPNVLMKHEAVQAGVDFTLAFDEEGSLAESSTENVAWVNEDGVLCHPPLDYILKGTTMTRVFDLVEAHALMPVNREAKLRLNDIVRLREMMMIGTTLDVLPVRKFEETQFASFKVAERLREILLEDQRT